MRGRMATGDREIEEAERELIIALSLALAGDDRPLRHFDRSAQSEWKPAGRGQSDLDA